MILHMWKLRRSRVKPKTLELVSGGTGCVPRPGPKADPLTSKQTSQLV